MVIVPLARRSVNGQILPPSGGLERVLGPLSIATMLTTVPQVINVWFAQNASGVSLVSWLSYLVAACLWFVHGVQRHDRSIYLACIGWIIIDGAVVIGIIARQS